MLFSFLGSIGIGLVWGWLTAKIFFFSTINFKNFLAFITSTSTFVGVVKYMYDWHHVGGFLIGSLLSGLLHYLWLKQLLEARNSN